MIKFFKKLGGSIRNLFSSGVDEEALEQLEELLFQADMGVETAVALTEEVRQLFSKSSNATVEDLIAHLETRIIEILSEQSPQLANQAPTVILIVGVNGNGKTTSVAKLAHSFQKAKQKVILGAADTFRAAAIDQLSKWSEQLGCDVVAHKPGSDPSAVVFDTITAGIARGADRILIDTAGRLHTKTDLMHELAKIGRVANKVHPGSPHETLLVLDATTGQNAIEQAKIFNQYTPLTGLILTKLDGTAKGGIVVAIQRQLNLPVKFIGTGESIDDLEPFDPKTFTQALLS